MYLYIIFVILALLIVFFFLIFNKIVILKNNVEHSYSTIDVMLKKRYSLIPNLVDTVKAFTKHESEILERLTTIRNDIVEAETSDIMDIKNQEVENLLNHLFVNVENYPELKSNVNYIQLQTALKDVEEEIAAARRNYNSHVTIYNTYISIIPINFVAWILRYRKEALFKIKEEEKELKNWGVDNEK